jgi:hypothetical protein
LLIPALVIFKFALDGLGFKQAEASACSGPTQRADIPCEKTLHSPKKVGLTYHTGLHQQGSEENAHLTQGFCLAK